MHQISKAFHLIQRKNVLDLLKHLT